MWMSKLNQESIWWAHEAATTLNVLDYDSFIMMLVGRLLYHSNSELLVPGLFWIPVLAVDSNADIFL